MEQERGSKLGKEYIQAVYCHPALFNFCSEYIMWNAGLGDSQAGINIAGKNINNFRYADDTNLVAESEEEPESLDRNERGEWKSWLKTQHSKN